MYVRVKVLPGARKESVTKRSETEFYITVKEKPERNLANKRVIELLAREHGVSTASIKMMTGHRSSTKMFSVDI